MAKKATDKPPKRMEEILWDSANKLRGSVEPAEYKHVVLSLIFLKFASDKFEAQRHKLIDEGLAEFIDIPEFYTKDTIFYLPEKARWNYIKKNAKQQDIAVKIDKALSTVETKNKALKGALPNNYFSNLSLELTKLSALIDTINDIDTITDSSEDIIGRVYEYFLSKFALAEGKGKGEFYTPKCIVNLIAELIEPYEGKIYDPCCGSGGMFVQSVKFVENHKGNKKDVSIYGQEQTSATYRMSRMNLAIRGISANFGDRAADTFFSDLHKDLKADYIMANPPFNLKDWRGEKELKNDYRWEGYLVPPHSNANYAWILHMISKLSVNGTAGFILANSALSSGGIEKKIREKIIENNLVEAILILPQDMFYTTNISVTIWILNKNKKKRNVKHSDGERQYRDRRKEVLFLDLRGIGEPYDKKFWHFTEDHIQTIAKTFHDWQGIKKGKLYKDVAEYCYSASIDEIREKDYSLAPNRYIEFKRQDENIDFSAEMEKLQGELAEILGEEKHSQKALLSVLKELGYEIKL